MQRAYSLLTLKAVDEDERVITGLATSPEVDRMGDIVEPKGAEFKLPIPLLWQHDSKQPIGEVFAAKVTSNGIEIKARIAKIDEPGALKDRLDMAWQSIKHQLVRGLSIGFQSLESARIEGTFGLRFIKWLWLELSAVTIPANGQASILAIKSADAEALAASGHGLSLSHSSVASDITRAAPAAQATKGARRTMRKSLTEQITMYTAERDAKRTKMDSLMDAAAEAGTTLDEAQAEEYNTLENETKGLDQHIARLVDRQKSELAQAKAISNVVSIEAGTRARGETTVVQVRQNLPPGFGFARAVLCKTAAWLELQKGNFVTAVDVAKSRYPDDHQVHQYLIHKTAVAGGTTTDSVWAAPLLADAQTLESEFLEYLRPRTIVGQFGANGIPALRRVPFNVKIQSQTTGGAAGWVGEGAAKQVTKFEYADTTLLFTKIAAIAVITEELARFSRPGAEGLVRDALAATVIAKMDSDFIDPAITASSGVRPASITNGVTPLTTAGVSADNARTDIQNLLETFILLNMSLADVVIIMPETLALALSSLFTTLAAPQFPTLGINGGRLPIGNIPVITSQYAANTSSYGNMVIAVKAGDIALADDGRVTVDASREASIQMDDASTQSAATGTGTSVTSMWQTNSIALRAEREIHWKKLRSGAVAFMDDVNWGSIGSPV